MMQRISNRNIRAAQYYPVRMILEIQFMEDNVIYQYLDVPEEVWYQFRNVPNIDIYFNSQIMCKYKVVCKEKGNRTI